MITNVSHLLRGKRKPATALGFVAVVLGVAASAAAFFVTLPPPVGSSRPTLPPRLIRPVEAAREAPDEADLPNPQLPLCIIHQRKAGVPFVLIEGGVAQTRRAALRCGVEQFVQQAGAQAG